MLTLRRAGVLLFCCALCGARAEARTAVTSSEGNIPPPHLSVVEGQVFVDREDRSEPAAPNLPLIDGDRLRTDAGRAEVIFPDGSLLHVDRATTVDVLAEDLVRLLRGRVAVTVRGVNAPGEARRYQIDAAAASVQTRGPGECRVSTSAVGPASEVTLAVFRGEAVLANDAGAEYVRAGEMAAARDGLAPSRPAYFNSARWDEFDRWSADRRDAAYSAVSSDYLPQELGAYAATFDQYGVWRDDPIDGRAWYPSVNADWRPYSVGYWRDYPVWDAFWVAGDPWGWPTHHFGRWGYSSTLGWYWIPTPVWGPSWVYWAHSPGYVSWCALGRWDNPVFGLFGLVGSIVGDWIDPWRGWNIIERRHYGSFRSVHRFAFDGRRLRRDEFQRFAVQRDRPGGSGGRRGGPSPDTPGGARNARRPDGPGGGQRPSPGAVPRRSFAEAGSRPAAGLRTESMRRTPDVMTFSNRRTGTVERVSPLAGSPSATHRPADQRSPGLGASSSRPYPRSSGAAIGAASRPAYQRSPGLSAGGSLSYPRGDGTPAGATSRPAYQRSPGVGAGSAPSYSRGSGIPAGAASRPAYQRSPGVGAGSAPSYPRGSGGTSSGMAPRSSVPRGGGLTGGSSSSRSVAPRYNSGSGGSRPSGGGQSSARPRGGRGRTP